LAGGWCWFVLREKYCWLVVGGWFVLREKYCWLVADKPSEQGGVTFDLIICRAYSKALEKSMTVNISIPFQQMIFLIRNVPVIQGTDY
jgi:hypothetical protein